VSRNRVKFELGPREVHELRRIPVGLVRFNLPPVGYVAAVEAVELLGNAVVTSWALIPTVLLPFIVWFSFKLFDVPKSRSMIIAGVMG
jgi:hypothetical protein